MNGSILPEQQPLLRKAEEEYGGIPKTKALYEEIDVSVTDWASRSKPSTGDGSDLSYLDFLYQNRNYRFFISSFLTTNFGEWLTYIASIDLIETIHASEEGDGSADGDSAVAMSRTAISILVVVRLLPNVFLSALGGTLADSLDRRITMIVLDVAGAICAGIFVLAYELKSIPLLYVATLLQQCIAGLYAPSHGAMMPQLVQSDQELKKATTIEGLTWSAMTAFGAAASGLIVDALGIRTCFIIDSATYVVSAILLCMVRGSYKVSKQDEEDHESLWHQLKSMVLDGVQYLRCSFFGSLVLIKGSGALAWGACDVLNVAFSEGGDPALSANLRLGILFSLVGVGCLLGPLLAEPYVHVEKPRTLQISCTIAMGLTAVGYFGWALVPGFTALGLFTVVRAAGSSTVWIHSTLLLQKFSSPKMLGRVMAADYAIALVCEASAAFVCGLVMDHTRWNPYEVSLFLGLFATAITLVWLAYDMSGRGARQYQPEGSKNTMGQSKNSS